MTRERIALGKLGEELALKKIKRLGYKCITRNYRCSMGEVDIIARDGDCLVFVEIKTRKGKSLRYAKEAINERKKRQISRVALAYMKANNCCDVKSRFDVVAINLNQGNERIEVIQNAFDLAY
ncbi:MAG: YraN family protein [Thermodesulfobacteriota bacterium]|nr:YraN family protein [Thermodesulfobacteriota bacterium]